MQNYKENKYLKLIRFDKPVGTMLLFIPCFWSLIVATFSYYKQLAEISNFYSWFYSLCLIPIFFLGSFIMRSAGCIINDIMDRNIDKKVTRTKNRPLADGTISLKESFVFLIIILFFALILGAVLMIRNIAIIYPILVALPLVAIYPLMKRITNYPQIFLGITFNLGVFIAWLCFFPTISYKEPIIIYIIALLWTIGYDTIYGFQDIKDDLTIGIKSTAITFGNNAKIIITIIYLLMAFLFIMLGLQIFVNHHLIYTTLTIFSFVFILYHLYKLDIYDPKACSLFFNYNVVFGFFIAISMVVNILVSI